MMNRKGMTIIWCVISAAAACGLTSLATKGADKTSISPIAGWGSQSGRKSGIDVNDPRTWESTVGDLEEQTSNVARTLLGVGKDEERDAEERRKAVFLLGRIKTEESIGLLVENIGLHLPVGEADGDDLIMKMWPCHSALTMSRDWRVAQVVLKALDKHKSELELVYLGSVLDSCLGRGLAQTIVNREFQRAKGGPNPARMANLEKIRANLSQ